MYFVAALDSGRRGCLPRQEPKAHAPSTKVTAASDSLVLVVARQPLGSRFAAENRRPAAHNVKVKVMGAPFRYNESVRVEVRPDKVSAETGDFAGRSAAGGQAHTAAGGTEFVVEVLDRVEAALLTQSGGADGCGVPGRAADAGARGPGQVVRGPAPAERDARQVGRAGRGRSGAEDVVRLEGGGRRCAEAVRFAKQAKQENRASGSPQFSCWRYMKGSAKAFRRGQ